MKATRGGSVLLVCLIAGMKTIAAPAEPSAETRSVTASTNAGRGPTIRFATTVFDFGRLKSGDVASHDFVFTNIGQASLELSNVHAGCGCTIAGNWSRQVAPGQTGVVPIQFNSGGFGGPIAKAVTVTCNDRSQPTVDLQIKGTVWKWVEMIPQYAYFDVTPESLSNATRVVRIVNHEAEPLTLFAPESNNRVFAAELTAKQAGEEFELVVRLVPPLARGTEQGMITIGTSSTNEPVLKITTVAVVPPPLLATPREASLAAAPITNVLPIVISIRNTGPTPIALSDPAVNAEGVAVQMKAMEPGRAFSLTLTFPAGFEIAPGQNVELSVKTDHPQFPIFKVPVLQAPHPAP